MNPNRVRQLNQTAQDMTIGEVVKKHPETIEVFLKHNLHCVGCGMAQMETIEQGASSHNIDAKKLVEDLNKTVSDSS